MDHTRTFEVILFKIIRIVPIKQHTNPILLYIDAFILCINEYVVIETQYIVMLVFVIYTTH